MAINQPPGGPPGRLPVDLRPRRLMLLPYNDLVIDQGMDQFFPIDPSGFKLGLVLPYGLGPNEPRVFRTDDAGNLNVVPQAGGVAGGVFIIDPINFSQARVVSAGDTFGAQTGVVAISYPLLFGGATFNRQREGSAAVLASILSIGSALVVGPGQWSGFNNGALGAASSFSRGAGGAGVRHVCTGYSIVVTSQAAPAAGALTVNLRDGASGAGGILEQFVIQIPAALYAPIVIARTGLEIVGTAATAMTLESSAAYAAVGVSLNLEGYDAS